MAKEELPVSGKRARGFPWAAPQAAVTAGKARRGRWEPSPSPADKERGAGASPGSSSHSVPPATAPARRAAGRAPGREPTPGKSSPSAPPQAAPAALMPVPPGPARIHVEALAHVLDEVGRLLSVRELLVGLHAAAPRGRVLQLLAAEEPARRGRGAAAAPRRGPGGARARRRHDTSSSSSSGTASRRLHRASRESSRARARSPP